MGGEQMDYFWLDEKDINETGSREKSPVSGRTIGSEPTAVGSDPLIPCCDCRNRCRGKRLDQCRTLIGGLVHRPNQKGEGEILGHNHGPAADLPSKGSPIKDALDRQEGGHHYKGFVIQPVEFAWSNRLDLCQANVVKYVCRFRDKGGIEDLRKARHYLELLAKFEYDEVL